MDPPGRPSSFQPTVVSSLLALRQNIWKDISSMVSDVRDHLDNSNREHNDEIKILQRENQSLHETLDRMQAIIEGKEIELCGLRHQLQSFCLGRPVCFACSRNVQLDGFDNMQRDKLLAIDHSWRMSGGFKDADSNSRKRDRADVSLSSVDQDPSSMVNPHQVATAPTKPYDRKGRPSQKRFCTHQAGDNQPTVLVAETQGFSDDAPEDHPNIRRAPLKADSDSETADSAHHSPPARPFHVPTLSPPSQLYDASMAIANAVNHADLADYESIMLDFHPATSVPSEQQRGGGGDSTDESSSTFTISENPNRSPTGFEATYRRRRDTVIRVPRRSAHHYQHHQQCDKHQRLSLRSHKPSCRYFGVRHNSQPKGRKSNKVKRRPCYTSPNKESDDTGADLSLPSDFLDSNASDIARESHPKPINRDNRKSPDLSSVVDAALLQSKVSDAHLPSIGGSPTSEQGLFKRPSVPSARDTATSHVFSRAASLQPRPQPAAEETDASTRELLMGKQFDAAIKPNSSQASGVGNKENDQPIGKPVVAATKVNTAVAAAATDSSAATVKCVGPVERRKAVRREMPAFSCASCREYYGGMDKLSSPERAARLQRCSRHRATHGPPPSTPKGFWDLDITDSENPTEQTGAAAANYTLRRRRPLTFPAHANGATAVAVEPPESTSD